jgi:hypothetical protein
MAAEFVKRSGGDVIFIKDGKEISVPLSRLSSADQAKAIQISVAGGGVVAGGGDPFQSTQPEGDADEMAEALFNSLTGESFAGKPDDSEPGVLSAADAKKELTKRREWTDDQDQKIQAKYVRMFEGQAVLSRGRLVTKIPFHSLSEDDQAYLTERLTEMGEEDSIPPKPVKNAGGAEGYGGSMDNSSGPSMGEA